MSIFAKYPSRGAEKKIRDIAWRTLCFNYPSKSLSSPKVGCKRQSNFIIRFDNQMVPHSSHFVIESTSVGFSFVESILTTAMHSKEACCNRKRRKSAIYDPTGAVIWWKMRILQPFVCDVWRKTYDFRTKMTTTASDFGKIRFSESSSFQWYQIQASPFTWSKSIASFWTMPFPRPDIDLPPPCFRRVVVMISNRLKRSQE